MRRAREISCSFDLDPLDCTWLQEALSRFGAKPGEEAHEFALYLDTQQAEIGNRGLAFSLRRSGEISSEELKAAIGDAARVLPAPQGWVHQIEPLSEATPAAARRRSAALLLDGDVRQSLRVLFQIDTRATRWDTQVGDACLSITVESSRIAANRSQTSYARARFRCQGEPAGLFQLLASTSEKLRLSAEESALRGYRFCELLRGYHATAFAPKLTAGMDAVTAFRTIARACLDHFLLNEVAVRRSRDREAVHQCRVALRRLSASLRLFSPLISRQERKALRDDVKCLTASLRNARDLDVVIADSVAPAIGNVPPDASQRLMSKIEARRDLAYRELVATLSTASTAALFLRLVEWIEFGDWAGDPKRTSRRRENVVRFAERSLAKAAHKFKARCARLEEASRERRHRIRILAKNLRYSSEFFETFMKARGARRPRRKAAQKRFRTLIAALKDLQTVLGKQNDAQMARRVLASLRQEIGAEETAELAAIASIAKKVAASEKGLLRKAKKARRSLVKVKPFWRKL